MEGKSDIIVYGKLMFVLMLSCLMLLHFGCSSGGGSDSSAGVAQLKISTADTTKTATADGQESYTITAQVLNGSGVAMNEQPVAFRAIGNKGLVAFKPGAEGMTNADGTYTVTVTDISSVDDVFMVQATSGGKSASLEVRFFANQAPRYLALSLSQNTVKSDNSDSTEITATLLDANRAPIENITVAFQTMAEGSVDGGGQISSSTASTDEKGEATIVFRSGTFEKKNQDVTIEAWIPAFPDQDGLRKIIPVEVSGNTVSLSVEKTNLLIDPDNRDRASARVTISVRDAGGSPINNAEVIVEQIQSDGSAQGDVTITPSFGHTNLSGNFEVLVTGLSAGNVNVLAKSMGAQVSQIFSVGKMGETFGIETPIDKPVRLTTHQCLEIKARAPDAQWLRFATSLGSFVDSQCCLCRENSEICDYRSGCLEGEKTIAVNVDDNNLATVYLRSANPGIANVEVMDINNPIIKDTLTVAVVETIEMAARLDLQASSTVVSPSTGTRENTVTLHVMVRNDRDQPISGAPVTFSIENPTGGGERISPVIVFTDDYGKATSIFTSGALSSGANGVSVKAEVIRNAREPEISDTVSIVIGGTAASIAFGRGTVIESSQNETMYELPISVLVADSNGNPISGADISLGAWPVEYATGYWRETLDGCIIVYEGWYPNEDKNRNLILDEGEDFNDDGQLTPPSSDTGSLPNRVTTGENGSVDFVLTYPKASAGWIRTEISASTLVLGSETKSAKSFVLPWLEGDSCHLPNAPYDPPKEDVVIINVTTIRINAPETMGKKADGQESYSVTAQILDSSNRPIAGFPINFVALNTNGIAVIDPPFGTSNDNGTVTVEVKYINSDIGNFPFEVRALSDDKTANITLSFTNVAEPVEENEPKDSKADDLFYESKLSKSLSLNATNEGKNYNTYGGPSSAMGSHILKEGNFKIESSIWNMPGLAYGNRITQIIGYSINNSIDPQLLEGMPVLFVAEPGLTIENGRVMLGAEGRAMTMGRTQLLAVEQQIGFQEEMLMPWEIKLIEYVSETYNRQLGGYPSKGLSKLALYAETVEDGDEKNMLAQTGLLLTGQPLILFDRDSFVLGNGETAQVKVLICDENLNPLSPGTTVKISMNKGNLSGSIENTYQNSNVIGPDLNEHLKLIEYRLNISDPNPSINQYQADTITVDVLWEGITIRSRLDGSIR